MSNWPLSHSQEHWSEFRYKMCNSISIGIPVKDAWRGKHLNVKGRSQALMLWSRRTARHSAPIEGLQAMYWLINDDSMKQHSFAQLNNPPVKCKWNKHQMVYFLSHSLKKYIYIQLTMHSIPCNYTSIQHIVGLQNMSWGLSTSIRI